MRDLVLLGAGASIEAGVPGAFDLTDAIRGQLAMRRDARNLEQVFDYVCERLGPLAHDIERLASAVEMLSERESLEVNPFVERWYSDGWMDRDGLMPRGSEGVY